MTEERKFIARLQITGAAQVKSEADQAARSVEQAGARMTTAWQRIGGQAEGLESGFKKLNRGVNDARGSIELLGGVIPGLEGTFGTLARTIGNLSDVFGTLSALFLRNPIGLLATAIASAAAAYLYFSKTADEATADVEKSGGAAAAAAIDWSKLVDPMKAVAGLIDEIKAKQIQAVGGPRLAIDQLLQQKRSELAKAQFDLAAAQAAFGERDIRAREPDTRPIQEQFAEGRDRQARAAEAAAGAKIRAQLLKANVEAIQSQIKQLEIEERRLRDLEVANVNEFAGRGEALQKIKSERAQKEQELDALGAAAAAEQQKQLDALLSKYAPAIKAEEELAKAREQAIRFAELGVISGREYEQVIASIADAEFKATEEGQRRIELERQAAVVIEEVKTAQERYAEAIDRTNELQRAGLITEEQANRKREAEAKKLDRVQNEISDEAKRARENARELGLAFSSAFEDAIVNGRKVQDVIKGLGQDLLRVFIRRQLTEPLLELFSVVSTGGKKGESGGGFGGILETIFGGIFTIKAPSPSGGSSIFAQGLYADGAAFHGGNVIPFARGGVVDRPTIFPMARGMGLMGEAGPEAVMPLARDGQGRLGVRGGGQAIVINQTIDARNADASIRRELPAMMERTKRETIAAVEMLLDKGGNFSRKSGRRSA